MEILKVTSTIEHKHQGLPRFVCIPMSKVDPWKLQGTTTVEVNDERCEYWQAQFEALG